MSLFSRGSVGSGELNPRSLTDPYMEPFHRRAINTVSPGPPDLTRTSQHFPALCSRVSAELIYSALPRYRATGYSGFFSSEKSSFAVKDDLCPTTRRTARNSKTEGALRRRNLVADEISRAATDSQRRNPVYGTSSELFPSQSPITLSAHFCMSTRCARNDRKAAPSMSVRSQNAGMPESAVTTGRRSA